MKHLKDLLVGKEFKVRSNGTLFGIDWDWVRRENRCPLCGCKLYPSVKYPDSILCRGKKHKFFKIKKWTNTCYTGNIKK